ncbi:MAG TPA: beta galactosidase jelly roll domain-containing protein [Chthoniobacteraceae bacterium]|nr:beta galactosidase jelly roll domain-containing protein [Chthoniobacteraceae bacterium]
MTKFAVILLAACGIAACAHAQQPALPARDVSLDADWRFHLGDAEGAEKPETDDSAWRKVDVPHDYAIEGAFDQHSPAGGGGGYLTAGMAWYRKTFTIPAEQKGMAFTILFDGVYMNSDVWINGFHLGNHPYGYTGFSYDLTEHLNYGAKPNVLAVRVNVQQPCSRW